MNLLTTLLAALLLTGCASNLKQSAHLSTAADIATTTIGITSGVAYEANPLMTSPLGIAVGIGARIALVEYVDKLEEPKRTEGLILFNSVWWGVVISNTLVVLTQSTPLGLMGGVLGGIGIFKELHSKKDLTKP